MAGEAASSGALERAPLLHGASSERVRFAPAGVTPFANGDVSGRGALRSAVNLRVRDRVRAALRLLLVRGDGPRVHLFDRRVRAMGEWERRELS